MSLEDLDHLPVRTITTGDTFNDWRRITNSIAQNAGEAIETGSHLYLGDYDWSEKISRATRLPVDATTGDEINAGGASWDPADSVSYDSTEGGIRVTLANATDLNIGGIVGKWEIWGRIRTRFPIDSTATYRIKVRVKNLRTTGENRVYFAAIGLNEEFEALATDDRHSFNWGIASNIPLPNNDITEYSALYYGFNATDESDSYKFDPGSKFFDIAFISHYQDGDPWESANDDIIIQSVEIERLTSGIIVTNHDSQDGNPSAKLHVGYSSEYTVGPIQSEIGLAVKESILVQGGRIIFSDGSTTPDNPNNIDQIYSVDLNNSDDGNSYHFSHDRPLDIGSTYGENKHGSTLRAGKIVMDTQDDGINSLRSQLFIGRHADYTAGTQTASPLLSLAVGSENADETGAGPAINFYTPDRTDNELLNVDDIKLAHCHLSGQIACVKSETGSSEAAADYGTGDLVFKVAKNAENLEEILRLHPGGYHDGTTRLVTIGGGTNADLKVTGKTLLGKNNTYVEYTWPQSITGGGAAQSNTKVLTSDTSGNLAWKEVGTVTQNITAFVQNETAPLGTVFAWPSSTTIPDGFAECKGQSISTLGLTDPEKSDLQAVLGKDTLPDLQKRVVVGREAGTTGFEVHDTGGAANVTGTTAGHALNITEIPAHAHQFFDDRGNQYLALNDGNLGASGDAVTSHGPNESGSPSDTGVKGTTYTGGGADGGINGGTTTDGDLSSLSGTATHSHNINITNGNYQPYVALTYIMKVKADKIATLDISVGDINFNPFTVTGGVGGNIDFNTTNLKLSDGHPTWATGVFRVSGNDLTLNQLPNGNKRDSNRENGRALVASTTGLALNWSTDGNYDFSEIDLRGNKVIARDLSNSEIDAAGNQSLITKGYLDNKIAETHLPLAEMGYDMGLVSPSGAYSAVERFSHFDVPYVDEMGQVASPYSGAGLAWWNGAISGAGYLFTHPDPGASVQQVVAINSNREWFAKAINIHPTLDLKIKVDFQFISNTDDASDHVLSYRLKQSINFLDTDPGNGTLTTVEQRLNTAGDGGNSHRPDTWSVRRTVTNREITVPSGHAIFFKFVGTVNGGSGQDEGVGLKGFNIHSPVWS